MIREAQIYVSIIDSEVPDIRRSHILADALREAWKGKYDPTKIVNVHTVH